MLFVEKKTLPAMTLTLLLTSVLTFNIQPVKASNGILAETINFVSNNVNWQADYQTAHYGVVFNKLSPNTYDSIIQTYASQQDWVNITRIKRLSEVDGYSSAIIDQQIKMTLTNFPMLKHLPRTGDIYGTYYFHVGYRFALNAYRYSSQLVYETSKWDKSLAYQELLQCYKANGKPSIGYDPVINTAFQWVPRYYDESAETLSAFLMLSDGSNDGGLWDYINQQFWTGSYFSYQSSGGTMECEVGPFNIIIAQLYAVKGYSLPNFDRCVTDLYTKLLTQGWNSPLWSNYVMRHATNNPQLRLENTLQGLYALQAYYPIANANWKQSFINLLSGAWQGLLSSPLYDSRTGKFRCFSGDPTSDYGTSFGLMTLFLEGIVPSTGSLAMPLIEEMYEDPLTGESATHFQFNYANRQIRIPVWAGELKFLFGSNTATANFPTDGIYEVTFSSDWNTVQNIVQVANLGGFYYIKPIGTTPPPPPPTYSLIITSTDGGTTSPALGTYSYTANSTVQVTAIPNTGYLFDYWELDGVNVDSGNPYSVLMDENHTLKTVFSIIPPPLSASISPLSASMLVGQSVTFTSTVSGGYTPYSYQWYINGAPVSGATSNTWTFTPTASGIYYVYLQVTDANNNAEQSEIARVTVSAVPVGGYSISIQVHTKTEPVLPYIALIAMLTAIFTKLRPKTKRKR